ncbi:hypothetical protein PPERSA_01539 [Pseudocohnilembus persalinus]|uniref:Uncharacterized protein n=1 Tax=Pseudocohnilembus persalinus TaxID=266149 RepID=A0A0V0R7Q4_PSEPJ|nr:hypothetical protein PPERSA_01539 [Pseudocohnilembus persalinus]|eukprot:KRX10527.1 hypothetical protein PPERSA_01539 [Pseudocohnilembus persalinus]
MAKNYNSNNYDYEKKSLLNQDEENNYDGNKYEDYFKSDDNKLYDPDELKMGWNEFKSKYYNLENEVKNNIDQLGKIGNNYSKQLSQIDMATSVKTTFASQRNRFQKISKHLSTIKNHLPEIGHIAQRVRWHQYKNQIIISSVIALQKELNMLVYYDLFQYIKNTFA